jgi:transcriptional regulator
MYIPEHFAVTDIKKIHGLIGDYPLATLVTYSKDGLNANPIPMYLEASPEGYGILQAHIARANPLLEELNNPSEALAIFHGPNAYITPSWYASKKAQGKVVPTWNYAEVHAYGTLKVIEDKPWLLRLLNKLTDQNEARFPEPWAVADAPVDFTEKLLDSIIGIELEITRLIGKWKVSQNQPEQNQHSVIQGLNSTNNPSASIMAGFIKVEMKHD